MITSRHLTTALVCATTLAPLCGIAATKGEKPNVIIIYTDDQGYQDLGCYDSPRIKTPCLDNFATEGMRLTSFYVSASVSSASRAGLLTGRLNTKNGVTGALFPGDEGMASEEITLAEALKEVGYSTGIFGKWHLGDLEKNLPATQGFDRYFGIPYSNDMYIGSTHKFADDVLFLDGYTLEMAKADQKLTATKELVSQNRPQIVGKSPLFLDNKIVEYPCDQSTLTRRYIDHAIEFIKEHKDEPFFAYITPNMPHIPLYASEQFKGKSEGGLYGDCVEEIDWNVGRLLEMLDEERLSQNTIVIFATDNGPWIDLKNRELAGHADPLKAGKFSQYDGGVRTPCIIRWPGVVPAASQNDNIIASIDLFPTIMHYAGVDKIAHEIDGMNVSKSLENPKKEVRDEYLYVRGDKPYGVRKGDWVYLPESGAYKKTEDDGPELFNITEDIGEDNNLYSKYPKKVAELQAILDTYIIK